MTNLIISYKGNNILTANDLLTRNLDTSSQYYDDDITIKYTRPTFSTQSKMVSPSTSQQRVTSDSEYDGLSSVTINAMMLYTGALRGA